MTKPMIAALPMYDWPERHAEVDAEWVRIRDRLRAAGIESPEHLTRQHEDLYNFWRRPDILFSQTCWGPMEDGLAEHVQVIGQPSYDGVEGGQGGYYSSAIVMRADNNISPLRQEAAPQRRAGEGVELPVHLLRGKRFAYNVPDSMSGYIGMSRDLEKQGENLAIFSEHIATGGHRKSVRAVASGEADVAAIDCRSWQMAKLYEPEAAAQLQVVGWTSLRKGLPFITSNKTPPEVVEALRQALR